jgi:hypothetical protein
LETSALLNVENEEEETEAEKRRRKHLGRPRTTTQKAPEMEEDNEEGRKGEEAAEEEEEATGPEYTLAEQHPPAAGRHAFRTEIVEIGRPRSDQPSARRLRRLRHQRRRELGGTMRGVEGQKQRKHKKMRRASERAANLRRRAER